jgi:hypothetical protein
MGMESNRNQIAKALSYTNSQAAQAQAWQRVCLSNRTTKTTDAKEQRRHKITYMQARVSCSYESEVLNSSFVHLLKFSA